MSSSSFLLEHPVEVEALGVGEFHASSFLLEHPVVVEAESPPHLSLSGSFLLAHPVLTEGVSVRELDIELAATPEAAPTLTDPEPGTGYRITQNAASATPTLIKRPPPVVTGWTTAQGSSATTIDSPLNTGYTMIAIVAYDREGVSGRTITPDAVPNGFDWSLFGHFGTANNDIGVYVFGKNCFPTDPATYRFVPSASFAMQIQIFGLATPGGINDIHDILVSNVQFAAVNTLSVNHAITGVSIQARSLSLMASVFSTSTTGNWTGAAPVGTWTERTDRVASFALGAPLHTTTVGLSVAEHTNTADVSETPGTVQMTTNNNSATLMVHIEISNSDTTGTYYVSAWESWLKLVLTHPRALKLNTFGSNMQDTVLYLFKDTPRVNPYYIGDDTSVEPYASIDPQFYWSSIPQIDDYINLQEGTYYVMVRPYDGPDWDESDPGVHLTIVASSDTIVFEAEDHTANAVVITDPHIGETFALADANSLDEEDTSEPFWTTPLNNTDTTGARTAWVKLVLSEPMWLLFDTFGSLVLDTVLSWAQPLDDGLLVSNDDSPEFTAANSGGLTGPSDTFGEPDFFHSMIGGSTKNRSSPATIFGGNYPFSFPAGTYYLMVQPFEGTAWPEDDNGDTGTTMAIRITRFEDTNFTVYDRYTPPALAPPVAPPVPHVETVITYDGTEITSDVIIESARFTTLVNGNIGQAEITIKDADQTREFTTGKELTLDIDGKRLWGGYVMKATKSYPFPALNTADTTTVPRYWRLTCADYNVLFQKRIVFDDANPTTKLSFDYPVGTYDDVIIGDIFNNYLPGISADGITDDGVERVAIVTLDIPGVTSGKGTLTKGRGQIASAGYTWKQAMDVISRATGAVYYISPSKVFTYVDAETVTSDFVLTDVLRDFDTQVGYQSFRILNDATKMINDMMVWGAATDPVVFSRTEDSDSIAEHGRWQEGLFTTGIYHQATADIVADSYVYGTPQSLRGAKDDAKGVTCRVFEPVFVAGEIVDTRINIFAFREFLPIRRMSISFVNPNQAMFDLTLSQEIDQPWSIFEFPPLEDIGPGNVVVPKVVLPKVKPPHVIDGIGGNPTIIDSFDNRTYQSLPGDGYEHDSQTTSYNGSWKQGEHINWGLSAFFQDHHNPVHDGRGWMFGGNAHYILVHEEGGYPNTKPMSGTVDAGIDCSMLLYKIGITRHEKLVKADFGSADADPDPPIKWQSRGNGALSGDYDIWGEWVPDYDAPGNNDIVQNAAAAGIPYASSVSWGPAADGGAGAITGTVYSGSDPGWGFGSDGGGLLGWTRRYAGGSRWVEGAVFSADWAGGIFAPYYIPSHRFEQAFYTAVDERDPATWSNMVYFELRSGGAGKIVFDKNQGGPANGMVISTTNEGGTPVTVSTQSFEFLPEEEYWVRWWRPNPGRSYARVWKVGDAEPTTWPIVSEIAVPSSTLIQPSRSLSFRVASQEFQTYWFWCDIIAAGAAIQPAVDIPPDEGEGQTEPDFGDGLVYSLGVAFIKESTEVYVNGYRQRRGFDYTEQPTAGTITFESPPGPFADTDRVVIFYAGNGAPS